MLLFNPIRLRDRLVEAGVMDHRQAEVFAGAISESDAVDLATKSDIVEIRSEFSDLRVEFSQLESKFSQLEAKFSQLESRFSQLDANFAKLEARLMRWMLAGAALGGLIGGLTAGLMK